MEDFKAALTGMADVIPAVPRPVAVPAALSRPPSSQPAQAAPAVAPPLYVPAPNIPRSAFPPPPPPALSARRWLWPVVLALIALMAILFALSRSASSTRRYPIERAIATYADMRWNERISGTSDSVNFALFLRRVKAV